MTKLEYELEQRNLPQLLIKDDGSKVTDIVTWEERKTEIKELLMSTCYGYPVRFPVTTNGTVLKSDNAALGGKARYMEVYLHIKSAYNSAGFPIQIVLPKGIKQPPVFLTLSFSPVIGDVRTVADGMCEEIIDNGYAIANIYYQDIAPDYYDRHRNGLGRFCTRNTFDSWGKLMEWGWSVSRMLDYLLQEKLIDDGRVAVIGHSRLGKAALLAGAFDDRISLTVSNNSGAGGAALFRQKTGERISNLYGEGSRLWFNGNFFGYTDAEDKLPFDQHFLLSLFAGRRLYVASASEDEWADPKSEFLTCVAASEAFALIGERGLVTPDRYPKPGDVLLEGNIGYHLREGSHYLGRYDWHCVLEYRMRHSI